MKEATIAAAAAGTALLKQEPVLAPKVNIPEEYRQPEDKSTKLNDGLTVPFALRLGSQGTRLAFKEVQDHEGKDRVIMPEDVRESGGAWVLHETPEGQLLIGRMKRESKPGEVNPYESVRSFSADDFRDNQVILPLGNLNLAVVGFDPATREVKVCKAEKPIEPVIPIVPEPEPVIPPIRPEPIVPVTPEPVKPETPPYRPAPDNVNKDGWRLRLPEFPALPKLPELRLPRLRRLIPFLMPLLLLIPQRAEPPVPSSPMPEVWGLGDSYSPKEIPVSETNMDVPQPQEGPVIQKEPDFEYHHYTTPGESVKGFTEARLAVEFANRYARLYEIQHPELQELADLAEKQPDFSPDEESLHKTLELIKEKFPGLTEEFQSRMVGSILKYNPDGTIVVVTGQGGPPTKTAVGPRDHIDAEDLSNPGNNFQFGVPDFRTQLSADVLESALAQLDKARQNKLMDQYGGGYQPV